MELLSSSGDCCSAQCNSSHLSNIQFSASEIGCHCPTATVLFQISPILHFQHNAINCQKYKHLAQIWILLAQLFIFSRFSLCSIPRCLKHWNIATKLTIIQKLHQNNCPLILLCSSLMTKIQFKHSRDSLLMEMYNKGHTVSKWSHFIYIVTELYNGTSLYLQLLSY